MKTSRSFSRVFLRAAILFSLAIPWMARPAQTQAQETVRTLLPITIKNFVFGNGTVTGYVINASLKENVPGAQVCWQTNCTYSDADGVYTLNNVASGYPTLTASKDGFITIDQVAHVVGNTINHQDIAIVPLVFESGLKYRVMTTWDDTPCWPDPNGVNCWDNDLDAHLWRWDISTPITYHVGYFFHYNPFDQVYEYWTDIGDCYGFPNACLERDARQGYGPETIALKKLELAMYYFGVFNANQGRPGVPTLAETSAVVRLYDITGLAARYEVPTNQGGDVFWYVFSLNGNTGEVIEQNCIIDYLWEYNTTTHPECP